MPKYRLIYFDVRGRAEAIRFLFVQAGVPYEDVRVSSEEWSRIKKSIPGNVLPVLEVDGEPLTQSLTIARHLARTFGLDGNTLAEKAKVEEIVDYLSEMNVAVTMAVHAHDKKSAHEKAFSLVEKASKFVEGQIEKSKEAGREFVVGSQTALLTKPDALDKYKGIQECREIVKNLPPIAAYLRTRKTTPL